MNDEGEFELSRVASDQDGVGRFFFHFSGFSTFFNSNITIQIKGRLIHV